MPQLLAATQAIITYCTPWAPEPSITSDAEAAHAVNTGGCGVDAAAPTGCEAPCLRGLAALAKALPGGSAGLSPTAAAAAASALECSGGLFRAVLATGAAIWMVPPETPRGGGGGGKSSSGNSKLVQQG